MDEDVHVLLVHNLGRPAENHTDVRFLRRLLAELRVDPAQDKVLDAERLAVADQGFLVEVIGGAGGAHELPVRHGPINDGELPGLTQLLGQPVSHFPANGAVNIARRHIGIGPVGGRPVKGDDGDFDLAFFLLGRDCRAEKQGTGEQQQKAPEIGSVHCDLRHFFSSM
ncbi:MAG: hypothetical protein L0212_01830 [Acidobacteria bacterium]|nr:hypothetical protein [Acidobacteriota bacterium]